MEEEGPVRSEIFEEEPGGKLMLLDFHFHLQIC